MEDFRAPVRMLRYAARSLAHQLQFIPADRLDWKPEPDAKSAMEIAGEVVGAIRMYLPMLRGVEWQPPDFPRPATLDEAKSLIAEAVDEYAAALEAAGPELERPQPMPFGATFWAAHAALFPVIEVIHHHGQICYLQSLLGDKEMHWDWPSIEDAFVASEPAPRSE